MATLAPGGRIDVATVDEEVARLRVAWGEDAEPDLVALALGPERAAALDRFDRVQLEAVLRACRSCESLSEAGRLLFAASRAKKATTNDAHRLRQYLAKHGLDFEAARRG
jgi:transcriptional regulatory protein RtcR